MRILDIITESPVDDVLPELQRLGYNAAKHRSVAKIVVPRKDRLSTVQKIAQELPGATVSPNGKVVHYNGAKIEVKPEESQHGGLNKEIAQRGTIDGAIKAAMGNNDHIMLQVGRRVVQAAGAVKPHGNPKADVEILDPAGKAVAWISLKAPKGPGGAFKWGGWLKYRNNDDISNWIKDIIAKTGGVLKPKESYAHRIDVATKLKIMYGSNFGSAPGVHNVDEIIIGNPHLENLGKIYSLKGDVTLANGDLPPDHYDPIAVLAYRPDRHEAGMKFARAETDVPAGGRSGIKSLPPEDPTDYRFSGE